MRLNTECLWTANFCKKRKFHRESLFVFIEKNQLVLSSKLGGLPDASVIEVLVT